MVPQRQHCQARENRWTRWMEHMLPTSRSDKSASSSVLINSERAKVDSSDNCLNAAHTTRTWLLAGHEDKAQQFSTCHQKTPHLPPEHPTCHHKTAHLPPEDTPLATRTPHLPPEDIPLATRTPHLPPDLPNSASQLELRFDHRFPSNVGARAAFRRNI